MKKKPVKKPVAKKQAKPVEAWTGFWDMHSGGGQKLKWARIYIEAPETEARVIFQNRFDRNPERVTCTCCGEDYSITESTSLAQSTGYARGCDYNDVTHLYIERPGKYSSKYRTLEEYEKDDSVLIVRKESILPRERKGTLAREGYVWMGK